MDACAHEAVIRCALCGAAETARVEGGHGYLPPSWWQADKHFFCPTHNPNVVLEEC